jgi:hypothetical protein
VGVRIEDERVRGLVGRRRQEEDVEKTKKRTPERIRNGKGFL